MPSGSGELHPVRPKTRLGDYGIGRESPETIIAQLEQHGMTSLGEHDSVTLEQSRTVPESSP